MAFELRLVKEEKPATEPLFLKTVEWAPPLSYYAYKFWERSKLRLFFWHLRDEWLLLVVRWPAREPETTGNGIMWPELLPRLYRLTLFRLLVFDVLPPLF